MTITIPPAALEAACRKMEQISGFQFVHSEAAQVLDAALSAWPGMHVHETQRSWLGGFSERELMLPLPQQENSDD